jgi:phytoene dehydrogenase-like protein
VKGDRYDAVVIGAGVSGLTAAAYLARGGARVLVLEQAEQVGGLINSFTRDGYHFDGGVKALENSGLVMPILAQLGVLDQIEFRRSRSALILDGRVKPVGGWEDVVALFHHLGDLFPEDVPGLRQVLRDTQTVFDLLDGAFSFPIPLFGLPGGTGEYTAWLKQNGKTMLRSSRAMLLTRTDMRSYLRRHLRTAALVDLLCTLFPDGTGAFFGLAYFHLFADYYYPRGGMQVIPSALAEAVRRHGGEIRLSARVQRLLLSDGQASGVALSDGEEIAAGHVVAAADMRQTFASLLPAGMLPARLARDVRTAGVSHSVFQVFLGLDMPPDALGLQGCQHVFYFPVLSGVESLERESGLEYYARAPQEISVPALYESGLAPPGKTGLNISVMTTWRSLGGWEADPIKYEEQKQACARELIANLEKFVPGLSERIELCITASPVTIVSRTSNAEGAIMGWSWERERTLRRSRFLQVRSSVRTPVPRLLVAGQWAMTPAGVPTSALTGFLAADEVLGRGRRKATRAAAGT